MRKIYSALFLSSFSLALVGCMNPGPMPRGYVSYDQEYKSAPGVEARDIGYEYTNAENDKVMSDIRQAARDLVEKLDKKLSFGIDKVYLSVPANTAFYNGFDHMLRDEMTHRGYLLTQSPENAVRVEFVAHDDLPSCVADENGGYEKMFLALAIDVIDHVPSDAVSGFYVVPSYDYKPAGHVKIDMPHCEEDM